MESHLAEEEEFIPKALNEGNFTEKEHDATI